MNIIIILGIVYLRYHTFSLLKFLSPDVLTNYLVLLFSQILIIFILSFYDSWREYKFKISEKYRMRPLEDLGNYYTSFYDKSKEYRFNLYKEKINLLKQKTTMKINENCEKTLFIPGYGLGYNYFVKINNNPDKVLLKPFIPKHYPKWLYQLDMLLKPYEKDFSRILLNNGWNQLKYRPHSIKIDSSPEYNQPNNPNKESNTIIKLFVEPISYYYSFFAEQSADYVLYRDKNRTLRDILSPYFFATITQDSDIKKEIGLSRSNPIPNTLGIEILLVTKDGTILIKQRSKSVAVEKEKLDPGISGGLDWNTLIYYYKSNNYRPVKLSDAIKHELAEREELSPNNIESLRLYLISMTRNLRYLGKMNFLLIGYVPRDWKELYNLEKMRKAFETRNIIGIRIQNLWKELTKNKEENIDLCTLLTYIKIGLVDYMIYNLNNNDCCARDDLKDCPLLFDNGGDQSKQFCPLNHNCYHVEVKRILLDNQGNPSWEISYPIREFEALKYRDFSAVFLVNLKSLYDAYYSYCTRISIT